MAGQLSRRRQPRPGRNKVLAGTRRLRAVERPGARAGARGRRLASARRDRDRAVAEGILDSWLVPRLVEIGKALFYKERDWAAILHVAARSGLPAMPLDKLARWVGSGRVEQKRLDSLEMIEAIRAHLSRGVEPLIVSYEFHNTGYHQAATQRPT